MGPEGLFLSDEQMHILAQTFGCCRFIYNWGLHTKSSAYKERGKKLNYNTLAGILPAFKKQFPWLAGGGYESVRILLSPENALLLVK
jgi:hypothetical protein